jgi:hypothetical protein
MQADNMRYCRLVGMLTCSSLAAGLQAAQNLHLLVYSAAAVPRPRGPMEKTR